MFSWLVFKYFVLFYVFMDFNIVTLFLSFNGQEDTPYRDFIKHYITTQNYILIFCVYLFLKYSSFREPANFEEPPMLQNKAYIPCSLNGFKRNAHAFIGYDPTH